MDEFRKANKPTKNVVSVCISSLARTQSCTHIKTHDSELRG